jgi:hypothetical protein
VEASGLESLDEGVSVEEGGAHGECLRDRCVSV